MSLPPTPETKLRDGYEITSGQPAFTTCECSNTTRIRPGARHIGFHSHISSYSSMVTPWAPLLEMLYATRYEGRPRRGARTGLREYYCVFVPFNSLYMSSTFG